MADRILLKEIEAVVAALNSCEIRTLEDLRKCIGKDVDKNIRWLSEHAKVNLTLLSALLLVEFDDDAGLSGKQTLDSYWRSLQTLSSVRKFSQDEVAQLQAEKKISALGGRRRRIGSLAKQVFVRGWRLRYNWRRNWPDTFVILIVPVLLIGLALRAQLINKRNVPFVTVREGTTTMAFTKLTDNGAFRELTDNLALVKVPYAKGAFTSIDEVRGRYALMNLPGGSTLSSDQLLSAELSKKLTDMKEPRILSVPLKKGGYISTMKAPCEAIMVLSPRNEGGTIGSGASFSVIVLRVDGTGATLAIKKDDLDKASALLASHDVFLVQPA